MDVGRLIDELGEREEDAFDRLFVAPVVRGGSVCIRVSGVACTFALQDQGFEGWGVFKIVSLEEVRLEQPASPAHVRRYLERLTPVDLILATPAGTTRPAVAARPAGSRVEIDGFVPVRLVGTAQLFRHVKARFDGFNFWFERVHPGRNPAVSAYLRRALEKDLEPTDLDRAEMVPAELALYRKVLAADRARREDPEQRRLRLALRHSGATLDSFNRRGDEYTVTYEIGGQRHSSRVHAGDLTILSAGICLNAEDEKFDLQSIVGVMKEARTSGEF